jgi:hypothetical protein
VLIAPALPLALIVTRVRGETVWKIAEGVWRALLRRQKSADRDSFDPFWALSEPRFGTHSEFPNSFGRRILGSWTSALGGSEKFTNSSLLVGPCATH